VERSNLFLLPALKAPATSIVQQVFKVAVLINGAIAFLQPGFANPIVKFSLTFAGLVAKPRIQH
jgi:hypothetical protein